MTEISTLTVNPINTGAFELIGAPGLRLSVAAKTTNARMAVPRNSAKNARPGDMSDFSCRWASGE